MIGQLKIIYLRGKKAKSSAGLINEEYKPAKIRLSGGNYRKLVKAGFGAGSTAHITFQDESIPVQLLKPSAWREDDKYNGLKWNVWDIRLRRDCGCASNGEDEDCDHFWHDWTLFRSKILSHGKLTVKWAKFAAPAHVARTFINGKLMCTSEARERREAVRDALNSTYKKIWEMELDRKQKDILS